MLLLSKERDSGRPLDEEKGALLVHRFPRTVPESLEQLPESGERFQPARGGPGEGITVLGAVAG